MYHMLLFKWIQWLEIQSFLPVETQPMEMRPWNRPPPTPLYICNSIGSTHRRLKGNFEFSRIDWITHSSVSTRCSRRMLVSPVNCIFNCSFIKYINFWLVLRKQIDSLRYDRNRFEQVYEKLEKERVRLRQEIGKVIEESTQSYEQRWASVVFNSP